VGRAGERAATRRQQVLRAGLPGQRQSASLAGGGCHGQLRVPRIWRGGGGQRQYGEPVPCVRRMELLPGQRIAVVRDGQTPSGGPRSAAGKPVSAAGRFGCKCHQNAAQAAMQTLARHGGAQNRPATARQTRTKLATSVPPTVPDGIAAVSEAVCAASQFHVRRRLAIAAAIVSWYKLLR